MTSSLLAEMEKTAFEKLVDFFGKAAWSKNPGFIILPFPIKNQMFLIFTSGSDGSVIKISSGNI